MAGGNLVGFTDNFADNSTEAGFQFTFFCDICREGYKTRFTEAKSHKKGQMLRGFGRLASTVGRMAGTGIGSSVSSGTDIIGERISGMSPAWHKEHEKIFEIAQNDAKGHFTRCPRCTKWVCKNCWNEQEGLCTGCAPRVSTEVAAAKAEVTKQQIWEKAEKTELFTGKVESKVTICPACGKPAGEGKFCINCGAPLGMIECPKCGAKNAPGTRFCGECGTKLT